MVERVDALRAVELQCRRLRRERGRRRHAVVRLLPGPEGGGERVCRRTGGLLLRSVPLPWQDNTRHAIVQGPRGVRVDGRRRRLV